LAWRTPPLRDLAIVSCRFLPAITHFFVPATAFGLFIEKAIHADPAMESTIDVMEQGKTQ
jgi:hypothetical protein